MFTTSKRISKRGILNIACFNAMNKTPANEAVNAAKAPAQRFVLTPLRSQKFSPDASNLCAGLGKRGARFSHNFAMRIQRWRITRGRVPLANRDGSPVDQVSSSRRIF